MGRVLVGQVMGRSKRPPGRILYPLDPCELAEFGSVPSPCFGRLWVNGTLALPSM